MAYKSVKIPILTKSTPPTITTTKYYISIFLSYISERFGFLIRSDSQRIEIMVLD